MTDLEQHLIRLREDLLDRIAGTQHDERWNNHWKRELNAVQRALWALGGQA